jgi:diguanylate cyclase (GGDEF)-like protein
MRTVIPFGNTADENSGAGRAASTATQSAESLPLSTSWAARTEKQLALLQRLIGCAEVETIIERYSRWLSELGLAGGITYHSANDEKQLSCGSQFHHSAQYSLQLENSDLGSLTLFRRARYSEQELFELEQSLGYVSRCLQTAKEVHALQEMVTQDPLTGLGNRTYLYDWISREMSRSRRYDSPLAVMMIDVDHFKHINDVLGHLGGDQVLKNIARVFKCSTRGSDLLFRFGGDEFTILLPHTDLQGADEAARQIRLNLSRVSDEDVGFSADQLELRPDVSIGIAVYQAGDDENALLQRADTHLYHAKANGRGCTCHSVK